MEELICLLRIKVLKGKNLLRKDTFSSDPYVVIIMGEQKVKTRVISKNLNPEWNDELTLSIRDLNLPILLNVYDKDTLTKHDKMGDAEIVIAPYIECMRMGLKGLPDGTTVSRVQPDRKNCLADESSVIWNNGKMFQNMWLRLRNVAHGEVEIKIQWIDVPGSKGFC